MQKVLDYSFGTLWWVREELWEKVNPNFVAKRKHHPGLSLAGGRFAGRPGVVPMLVGTSKCREPALRVSNLRDPELYGKRVTHFTLLRPCNLKLRHFGHKKRGIEMNRDKPRINDKERENLERLLRCIRLGQAYEEKETSANENGRSAK